MADADLIEEHGGGHQDHHKAQRLGDPDGLAHKGPVEEVEAVRPQALDPEAAHAVPEEVEPGVLAVKVPGLGDDEEHQAEAQDVPEALIEEGGVDLHVAAIDGGEAHPPGEGGLGAEGLPVHEVAPAADGLAQHEAHDAEVRHGPQPDVLAAAVEEGHEEDRDDGAVDGEAAVPDGHDAAPVEAAVRIPEAVQVEENVVDPGPQDAEGHTHEDEVQQVILLDAVVLGLLQAEEHAEEHAEP